MEALQVTSIEQLPAGLTFLSAQLVELNERIARFEVVKPDEDKLYTRDEVATRLKISLPTLNEYTKAGKIVASRIGTRVLYREGDIVDALRAMKTSSTKRKP